MAMNRKYREAPIVASLLAMTAMATPLFAGAADQRVATVNGEAIWLADFQKNADPILAQFLNTAPTADQTREQIKEIKRHVLDQMIDNQLLVQQAKIMNIHVSRQEVDDALKKARRRFKTEDEFNREMSREGLGEEGFLRHVRDQLATSKLIDQEVTSRVPTPGDDEIKHLYDMLDILIKNQSITESRADDDQGELAALSKVVQRHFAERVRARHILICVSLNASQEERDAALARIKSIQTRLSNGEDFAELATKYSEDPVSKVRGGDLGYFSRGDMAPTLEKAAFALEVGQTSGIVQTNFGYHLIRLEAKKAASKITLDDMKDELRAYLLQKRSAESLHSYVKDLRSRADITVSPLMNL
jgi:parvulin-like peptidyl-prolyl isomerase